MTLMGVEVWPGGGSDTVELVCTRCGRSRTCGPEFSDEDVLAAARRHETEHERDDEARRLVEAVLGGNLVRETVNVDAHSGGWIRGNATSCRRPGRSGRR